MEVQQTSMQQQRTLPERRSSPPLYSHNVSDMWAYIAWVFLALGVFLRIYHYIDNRSLWIDEVYLASSLIKMNFLELATPPLDYEQKAPIGFLWMVRLAIMAFGNGEMALRLVPLIAGIASLFIFRLVARFFLSPIGVAVALGILAFAPPLIYHSVEVKQYITGLLAATLALYLYTRYSRRLSIPQPHL